MDTSRSHDLDREPAHFIRREEVLRGIVGNVDELFRRVAAAFEVARHVIVDVDLRQFGGSALTDERIAVENIDLAVAIYRKLLEGAGAP